MQNLKTHLNVVFETAPAANFRDANISALLAELHSSVTNPRDAHAVALHVLELVSAHLKSSVLAQMALSRAMGGPSE